MCRGWEPMGRGRCSKSVRTREGGRIVVDEAVVIARVRAGEPEAYAELVRAHTGIAIRAARALGAGADAEDVVQQAFIKALMLKAISAEVLTNPITLTRFIDAATDNLVVDQDLSVATMRSEAFAMRNIRSGDVVFITAPFTGFGTAPDGGSIDILDEAGISSLGKALRTDAMDTYADVSVIP